MLLMFSLGQLNDHLLVKKLSSLLIVRVLREYVNVYVIVLLFVLV